MSVRRVRFDGRQFVASFRATRRLANAREDTDGFWEATATLDAQRVAETREDWTARVSTDLEALPADEMGFRMRLRTDGRDVVPVCEIIGGLSGVAVEERGR